jgi:PAS domain S-box-containing protein
MPERVRRSGHDAQPLDEVATLRRALEEERALLDGLSRIAPALASELDADRLMQRLTDEATALVGAQFGTFFYNVTRTSGESYMLYTLSGVPRESFDRFDMPRNTAIFAPTFRGESVVRSDDITKDERYGKNAPNRGMPEGHLPVVSYLAVPVRSIAGEVLGGLFFGHSARAVFGEREERAALALSAIAGPALDNARLFRSLAEREAALQAANTRFRLVSDATREGIWYWDVSTNSVEWNDALIDALGIPRAAWGGSFDDWFALLHPDDQPRLSAALKAHLEKRAPYSIDLFRLRHASGGYRWFTTMGQAEWDAEGRPLRMAGSVRDITEKQLAEDALRASEHRYAQILDSVGDMIFCKNDKLNVVYANVATCRYYGMSAEQLRGVSDVPFNEIDFTKQYNVDDRDVFENGKPLERQEEPNLSPSGELRYFHTIKSPIFDESGKVVELVGVSRDVTERRRAAGAQRNLAEASAILGRSIDYEQTLLNLAEAIVPSAADWCAIDLVTDGAIRRIAVAHPDPKKVELAYELQRLYPTAPDAEHGVPAVIRTRCAELVQSIPEELLVQSARDEQHLAIIRALGLTSYIVVPMIAHGQVLGAVSLVAEGGRRFYEQDLAFAEELARRASAALENALLFQQVRELNASLERRVEERTSELLEANEELESFSYSVSHDLRAPIRHISGFIDLLMAHSADRLDEKGRRYIHTIKQASMQMGLLIDGLLAFSRLGRAEVSKQRVALGDLVSAVVRDLEPDTRGRDITWEIGDLPVVAADPTMLRLVLTNLVANALKYTQKRARTRIEIGCRREHEDTVWVKDNGTGFNMDYAHKLFGVFQRLHSNTEFDGTGIGLATAGRIVTRHGGRIWAEAVEDEGASFYFTLPHSEVSQ